MGPRDHLPRHSLIWLKPGATWSKFGAAPGGRLKACFAAGRPAVAARHQGDELPHCLRLVIALPPVEGKQRLSVAVPFSSLNRWRPPLLLREAVAHTHEECREALELPLMLADESLEPIVYGSFAWQALTGDRYVTPNSDLDLAWRPRSLSELNASFAVLMEWKRATGQRAEW